MIGTIIGSYKITEKIGEGGMGAVFKGIDEMLEREVAIKMLRPELARQPDVVERFRSEAITLAKLNHPNIATLYSFLRHNDDFFMVMEFVRGNTLESILRNFGAIPFERAVPLFCQALEGIDHAHKQGIIHRDIKPANAMVLDTGSVKVMDFGIARVLGSARMTRQGNVVGTVEYMSPEQIRGEETDARADIYSLGILLYEMLTGRVPFESPSEYELMKRQVEDAPPPPTQFASQIPVLIEQAIMRALAKKPGARFKTAGEFRSVLLGCMRSLTAELRNPTGNYAAPSTRIDQDVLRDPTRGTPVPGLIRSSAEMQQRKSGEMVPPPSPQSGATQAFVPPSNSKEITAPITGVRDISEQKTERFQAPLQGQRAPVGTQVVSKQPPVASAATQVITPMPPAQAASATTSSPSFFTRLNAKHYAAAAVLLIALISVPVALTLRKGTPPPATVETTEEPAAVDPQPSDQNPAPAATEPDPNSNTNILVEGENENSNTSDANKAARSKRNDKNANAATTTEPEQAPVETTPAPVQPQPVQATEPQPPPQETKPVVASEPEKTAEPAKKEEKKKTGIGGFFKKVFGGTEKKDEKKKDVKKPNP